MFPVLLSPRARAHNGPSNIQYRENAPIHSFTFLLKISAMCFVSIETSSSKKDVEIYFGRCFAPFPPANHHSAEQRVACRHQELAKEGRVLDYHIFWRSTCMVDCCTGPGKPGKRPRLSYCGGNRMPLTGYLGLSVVAALR